MSDKEKKEKSSKKRKQDGIAFAIWLLAFLVIVLLFIINWKEISANWNTHFNKAKPNTEAVETPDIPETDLSDETIEPAVEEKVPEKSEIVKPVEVVKTDSTAELEKFENKIENIEVPEVIKPAETPRETQKRQVTIYFLKTDSDGSMVRIPVKKEIPKSSSPLTDAIRTLLADQAPNSEYSTLIPSGTKLIGASVKNGVATLNFNDNFYLQNFGSIGFFGQLQQIVYTATEFPTVKSVQFLIEGKVVDFITEGLWTGSPLSRSNF